MSENVDLIKILYIDDQPDLFLITYMNNQIRLSIKFQFDELELKSNQTYVDLLRNELVNNSDILLIDSKLFEDHTDSQRFSGEELKFILQRICPSKEVIIITQNEMTLSKDIVPKFSNKEMGGNFSKSQEYYDKTLKPLLEYKIYKVLDDKQIKKRFEENIIWDNYFKERLLEDNTPYSQLTVEKIDEFINAFKHFEESINEN